MQGESLLESELFGHEKGGPAPAAPRLEREAIAALVTARHRSHHPLDRELEDHALT